MIGYSSCVYKNLTCYSCAKCIFAVWVTSLTAKKSEVFPFKFLLFFARQTKKKAMKQSIIEYSKQYSIVTQFTSFVAIEERDEEEKKKLQYGPDSTGKIL